MERVELDIWSDYLCPWCFNASVRLRAVKREFGDRLTIAWRSYLLRPRPAARPDLGAFRAYTESWLRPAGEPDSGRFRPWATDTGPPSHSIPPHLVAKAAATLGDDAFERVHDRLLEAYFAENRDISDDDTLREVWREADLPADEFARREDPALLARTLGEHDDAIALGVTGVPTVVVRGRDALVMGAQPVAVYRRWIERLLAG
ncbi:MAG TPA: DsbA family protein [Myxococcota bacterium]|nr:DsbA family protein [Myxococcota bacterium]